MLSRRVKVLLLVILTVPLVVGFTATGGKTYFLGAGSSNVTNNITNNISVNVTVIYPFEVNLSGNTTGSEEFIQLNYSNGTDFFSKNYSFIDNTGGDGNNFVTAVDVTGNGTFKTLTLQRSGLADLFAVFVDNSSDARALWNASLGGNTTGTTFYAQLNWSNSSSLVSQNMSWTYTDTNNYVSGFSIVGSLFTINRVGLSDLTATFYEADPTWAANFTNITNLLDALNSSKVNVSEFSTSYGSMYVHNESGQLLTIPGTGAYYHIDFLNASFLANMSSSGANLSITQNGTYLVDFSLSFTGGASKDYEFTVLVNGTAQETCDSYSRPTTVNDIRIATGTCVLLLGSGARVSLAVEQLTAGAVNVNLYIANLRVTKTNGVTAATAITTNSYTTSITNYGNTTAIWNASIGGNTTGTTEYLQLNWSNGTSNVSLNYSFTDDTGSGTDTFGGWTNNSQNTTNPLTAYMNETLYVYNGSEVMHSGMYRCEFEGTTATLVNLCEPDLTYSGIGTATTIARQANASNGSFMSPSGSTRFTGAAGTSSGASFHSGGGGIYVRGDEKYEFKAAFSPRSVPTSNATEILMGYSSSTTTGYPASGYLWNFTINSSGVYATAVVRNNSVQYNNASVHNLSLQMGTSSTRANDSDWFVATIKQTSIGNVNFRLYYMLNGTLIGSWNISGAYVTNVFTGRQLMVWSTVNVGTARPLVDFEWAYWESENRKRLDWATT